MTFTAACGWSLLRSTIVAVVGQTVPPGRRGSGRILTGSATGELARDAHDTLHGMLAGALETREVHAGRHGAALRVVAVPADRVRGGRGDQLVEVSVEVPTNLSDRAQELIEQLASELGEDVQPQQRTFVEKLKSLFG